MESNKKLTQVLAGGVQLGLDKDKPVAQPNAEIEDGEWVLDSEGLRQAKGDTHEDGGIDVVLEDGTKILSNHTKVTESIAKELSNKYGVKISTKDTYAEALEKVYNKLGIPKKNKEQEKVITKLDKQQEEVKDATTLALNTEALTNNINEIEAEKAPLEEEAVEAFNTAFEHQEARKPKEDTEDKQEFADGGIFPNRIANIYEDPNAFIKQSEDPLGSGTFGAISKQNTAQEIQRLFPSMYQEYFNEQGVPRDAGEYQLGYNNYAQMLNESAKNIWGETSERYKQFSNTLSQDGFNEGVRGFDNKFGNFTSTRPNYGFDIIPQDVYAQMQEKGINTYGQLKETLPELAEQYIPQGYALPSDAWLLPKSEPTIEDVEKKLAKEGTPEETATLATGLQGLPETGGTQFGPLSTPYNDLLPPNTMSTHLKARVDLPTMQFTAQTPDRQLQELQNSKSQAEQNLDMLPPAQRAAVIADITATTQEKANQVVTEVDRVNTAGFDAVRNFNSQTMSNQQRADVQNALNYERRQLLAKENTDRDIRNYINALERRQVGRYRDIQDLNLINAKNPNFQFTNQGIVQTGRPQFKKGGKKARERFAR